MTTKLIQNKGIRITIILTVFLSAIGTPIVHAGIFDWFSDIETELIDSNHNPSIAYLGDGLSHTSYLSQDQNLPHPMIITDNFLLASQIPAVKPIVNLSRFNIVVAQEMFVPITAYSSTPDQTDDSPFITAMGSHVRDGIVAANFLPFGTKIKIPSHFGDKIFVVEDRMNKRYWQKIDIWFPDRAQALNFGLRFLKIQILES